MLIRHPGKREAETRPSLSWPQALWKIRSWPEPYVMLLRYWKAFSEKPPPRELKALLERAFSGRGLYLYVHWQQTTGQRSGPPMERKAVAGEGATLGNRWRPVPGSSPAKYFSSHLCR